MTEGNHDLRNLDLTDAPALREELFRKLFQQYYRRIFVLFARWGFDNGECEDLVQEVFLRVHQNLDSFRRDSKFSTWLYQIAENVYKNSLRAKGAQKRRFENIVIDPVESEEPSVEELESPDPSPLEQVLEDEQRTALLRATQALPAQMRRCLKLRLQDFKYQEIATVLGVSLNTVRSLLFEARKRLEAELGVHFKPLLDDIWSRQGSPPASFTSHNVSTPKKYPARVFGSTDLIEAFLVAEHRDSPHTTAAYRRQLQGFLTFLGRAPITSSALSGYCVALLSDGRGRASHRQALAAVRGFLEWLSTTQGETASLPSISNIHQILREPVTREKLSRSSSISDEEAKALFRHAPTTRDQVMLGLLLGGGLKVNELVRIRVEDFKYLHPGSTLFVTVKGRTLPLPQDVGESVVRYLEETGRTWESPGFLLLYLPRRGGRPSSNGMLTNRAVEYRLRQLLSIAGLKDRAITSHSFRQTYAAQFLRKERDIETLKKLLGHASIATTERYLGTSFPSAE